MIPYLAISLVVVVVFSLATNSAFAVYETISIHTSHKSIPQGEKFVLSGELRDRNLNPIRSAEITFWEKDKTNQKQIGSTFTNSLGEYYIQIIADKWDGVETDVEIFASAGGSYSVKSTIITMYIEELNSFNTGTGYVGSTVTQPKITYHNTFLSLQVQDSSSQGYIKVKPILTYNLGNALPTNSISIYVDGKYSTKVTSNQWSSNIYAGPGADHTIKASVTEMTSSSNTSIKYRSSSDTVNYFVKAPSTQTPTTTPTPTPTLTQKSSFSNTSNESFPIEYVIAGIVITVVAVGIGIVLSKRKKAAPVILSQPAKVHTVSDETQFWVCPHCGNDTEYRNGKQFCGYCNVYL